MYCVVKSPSHDKPHDHLYPFGARFSYIFGVGKPGERGRFIDQAVKEKLVEIKDGHYKEWYPGKKQLKYEGELTKKGAREGKWNYYSEKGNLQSFTFYVAGKKNGHSIVKYPNGKIHYYGQYKDDQMIGEWVTYDEKGNKTVNNFNP